MNFVFLDVTDSTNSYTALHADELQSPVMVLTRSQSAGRGQRGNSWESRPGCNITCTVLFRPPEEAVGRLLPELQFAISEATALAVVDTLEDFGIRACVKWSNDVYVGDNKIAGILIEHSVMGTRIENSRIGIGLNVNQLEFLSDAPNPVSMALILGRTLDLTPVIDRLATHLERRLDSAAGSVAAPLHDEYLSKLWRADSRIYPFRLRNASGSPVFRARIISVSPEGPLSLLLENGESRRFMFRELEFILED